MKLNLIAVSLAVATAPAFAQVPWNPRAPENNQLLPAFN